MRDKLIFMSSKTYSCKPMNGVCTQNASFRRILFDNKNVVRDNDSEGTRSVDITKEANCLPINTRNTNSANPLIPETC